MEFTGLHRALGIQPGPLTALMLDEAIARRVRESEDLDWKRQLPAPQAVTQSDFPKDVAAMANAGGGVIVYGIEEEQKAATGRIDVGEFDETYERTLRSAAVTGISPPVFGLGIHLLTTDEDGPRAVAVVVPKSLDGPHLIYRGEYFGAPIRNDADTVWMRERQVEAMYRTRFEERRYRQEALDGLYDDVVDGLGPDTEARAWFIGVARPRLTGAGILTFSREDARDLLNESISRAMAFAGRVGIHPLESIDVLNPRRGLRRWIGENTANTERTAWRESWVSVHDDGSVTVASAIGGHRRRDAQGTAEGNEIDTDSLECAVADLIGLLDGASGRVSSTDYEVRVGIEWAGSEPLMFATHTSFGYTYQSASLRRYTPITASMRVDVAPSEFRAAVYDLVTDVVNQAGVREPRVVERSESEPG